MPFNADPLSGYFVTLQSDKIFTDQESDHTFCGPSELTIPPCPNCQRPLLRLLSLNTKDYRLNLHKAPFSRLSLLFCWTCELSQKPFYYVQDASGGIDILQYQKGKAYDDFPYENYPIYFPRANAVLDQIPNGDQEIITALNRDTIDAWEINRSRPDLNRPRHQIGGEPYLVQRNLEDEIRCLMCSEHIPFFAAVGDEAPHGMRFTGNEFVQVLFHYCRECNLVAAYQHTD